MIIRRWHPAGDSNGDGSSISFWPTTTEAVATREVACEGKPIGPRSQRPHRHRWCPVFRGGVIDHAVDTADFVQDTAADLFRTSFGDRDTRSAIIAIFRMHGADGT